MTLNRRAFTLMALAAAAASPQAHAEQDDRLIDALALTFPLYETARLFSAAKSRVNQLNHRRTLADHTSRSVTMPNNDTLYSSCWMVSVVR